MLKSVADIFKIPELRRTVLFTLGVFAVYRVGAYIPTPGIDSSALAQFFDNIAKSQGKGSIWLLTALHNPSWRQIRRCRSDAYAGQEPNHSRY